MDYEKLAESIDITDLTLKKVTKKFILENFEIPKPEEIETVVEVIPIEKILMGQRMTIDLYLGFVQSKLTKSSGTHIRTIRGARGIPAFQILNVTESEEISEKEFVDKMKEAIKNRIRKKGE